MPQRGHPLLALDPEGSEEGEDFFARSAIPPC